MREYIFRVAVRDPAHPLAENMLIEFGRTTADPNGFSEAVAQIAGMLRTLGTPEKVAEFMRDNAALAKAQTLKLKEAS